MRLVKYKLGSNADQSTRVAIVDEPGRKWVRLVFFDPAQITVTKVPTSEARFMTDIETRPRIKLSPLASTAKRWLKFETTKGARDILKRAAISG